MAINHILEAARQRPLQDEELEALKANLGTHEQVILTVHSNLYPLPAIQRAVYWLSGDIPLGLKEKGNGEIAIVALEPIDAAHLSELQKKLLITLNDFVLRLDIEQQTAGIRERLVQAAFAQVIGNTDRDAN